MDDKRTFDELNSELEKLNDERDNIDIDIKKNSQNINEIFESQKGIKNLLSSLKDQWYKDDSMNRWLSNVDDDIDLDFRSVESKFSEKEFELKNKKRAKENSIEDLTYEKRILQTGE